MTDRLPASGRYAAGRAAALPLCLAALLGACLLGGSAGCKGVLLNDMVKAWDYPDDDEVDARTPFLGVKVPTGATDSGDVPGPTSPRGVPRRSTRAPGESGRGDDAAGQAGVRVVLVLHDSPADQAGVREGDRIIRLGARTVRSAHDIGDVLNPETPPRLKPTSRLEVTVLRDNEPIVIPVDLRSKDEHQQRAGARALSLARAERTRFHIPFVFDYQALEISPKAWLDYTGRHVTEPVVFYTDVDLFPILGLFSLFRLERTPVIKSAWRVQVGTWPAVFTSTGSSEAYLNEIHAADENAYAVH